ncbi:ASC-1-like (ASCH) protein [Anaerobacterium chartisolvens]|uniref:ASC-1-like (ASCH) protein n=1 Tax=Anaerobacterium chartisolvens TaxID=1297424 RepID=A0A369BCL0_9FIRM|nr:ASCH domain-containing protein [Anaerobacterium chartisolvens]RCX19263.1 ASC-1-like (ASCH) protein [Anaerobacterium chartisolvens]
MKHYMDLYPSPFEKIANGEKTIELRLNDEKRQLINIGDEIEFTNITDSVSKLYVRVTDIYKFSTFEELYSQLPLDKCGYKPHELSKASPNDMDFYYSEEEQLKYEALGIKLELI